MPRVFLLVAALALASLVDDTGVPSAGEEVAAAPGTREQPRAVLLATSGVAPAPTAPPGPGPGPDDPWPSAGAPGPRSARDGGRQDTSHIRRALVARDGSLAVRTETLAIGPPDDGGAWPLVAYDLRALGVRAHAARAPGIEVPSGTMGHGSCGGERRAVRAAPLFLPLARRLVAVLGERGWDEGRTLLGWDVDHAVLWVRHHELALDAVEAELDRLAAERATVVPLTLSREPREGESRSASLRLDVPWHRPVTGHVGTVWTYLHDFDVEVSQSSFVGEPIFDELHLGLGVAAVRATVEADPLGEIDVEVAFGETDPGFGMVETSLPSSFVDTRVEVPSCEPTHRRRMQVAVRPGSRTTFFLGGHAWALTLGVPLGGGANGSWRRMAPDEAAGPPKRGCGAFDLEATLAGARSGVFGSKRCSCAPPGERFATVLFGDEVDRRAPAFDIVARAVDDGVGPVRIDLDVSVSRPARPPRHVDIDTRERRVRTEMPVRREFRTSRRVVLAPDESQTIVFEGDIGLGLERFDLRVRRVSPR